MRKQKRTIIMLWTIARNNAPDARSGAGCLWEPTTWRRHLKAKAKCLSANYSSSQTYRSTTAQAGFIHCRSLMQQAASVTPLSQPRQVQAKPTFCCADARAVCSTLCPFRHQSTPCTTAFAPTLATPMPKYTCCMPPQQSSCTATTMLRRASCNATLAHR